MKVKWPVRIIFAAVFSLFTAQCLYIIYDGLNDEISQADAVVIFGSKVNRDGHPSARLKARLDRGYELYRQMKNVRMIVSGGTGKEEYSEPKVMAAYLEKLGIPSEDILLDENGRNTFETARSFKAIAAEHHFNSVILVSQYFHITRAKLAFKKFGIPNIYSAHAHYFALRDLYSIPREGIAVYSYLLK